MPRTKLTERVIERLKGRPASSNSKEPIIWFDEDMPGFGVQVSTKTGVKTYIVQRDLPNGKTRRVAIGLYKTEIKTLDEARSKAGDLIHSMRHGIDPKAARKGDVPTLEQAARAYVDSHPNLAEKTKRDYLGTLRYLEDWKNPRLTEITPAMVQEKHKYLGEQHGNALANSVMRALRAWFYDAMDKYPEITTNPVKLKRKWFKILPRNRHVSADQLPRFYAAAKNLDNAIQRDWVLLLMFTGLRSKEAAGLAWHDVDFTARTIRFPALRTKAKRTLDLPMSNYVYTMLKARRDLGDAGFVFPANGKTGHIASPKHPFELIAKACGIRVSPHDLRRGFEKAAISAGVHTIYIKAMLNHAVGDDVTVDYASLNENDLREPMQKVGDQLKKWSRIK
jgi:integrase